MPGSLERSFFLYWITGEKHLEDRFQVGVITTTHGVRGEVKVFPTTDDVKRFKRLKKVILDTGKEEKILEVEGARFMKNLVLLKFKGYDSINDIEKYKGCSLYVTREDAVRLRKDEYFVADLIGMEVFLEDGSAFGKLTDVMTTTVLGSNVSPSTAALASHVSPARIAVPVPASLSMRSFTTALRPAKLSTLVSVFFR